ncbi:MAG: VOC family protein [Gammaproteobacteria bacterium]|nr:VOC family protein [Gammaproteobacteria bacterium]MDH4253151.1 VOC family protein [Gammaproteobacteria bacterium]MDH5308487.1 VOC family protein [Gammaproteobacteria bacterium]
MTLRKLNSVLLITLFAAGCTPADVPVDAPPAEPEATASAAADPMAEFGTLASNVFFYYADLDAAHAFYSQVLGLRTAADYGYAKIMQVAPSAFVTLVDAAQGMHSADEPKTTAIALVTDQLDEWWDHINTQGVDMRSTEYSPTQGSAHDGFVAVDPEGYLLEFERFNPHPENERFVPVLDGLPTLYPEPGTSNVPTGLGFKATIVWFYYNDLDAIQRFYEDVMGFDMIVDQGWTKIYPIGPAGFLGLVDQSRGMHRYTEQKGVTLSLITGNIDGWFGYVAGRKDIRMRHDAVVDEELYRAFVAYDPEGYFLEWDVFKSAPANDTLLPAIEGR